MKSVLMKLHFDYSGGGIGCQIEIWLMEYADSVILMGWAARRLRKENKVRKLSDHVENQTYL